MEVNELYLKQYLFFTKYNTKEIKFSCFYVSFFISSRVVVAFQSSI
jgi:hypothetical protein